ncbi:MAG TPA: hypothetical protein VH142_23585 [Polyangiaceae bacterium]|jgi:hypothetical protein|nr:hypothetical protein [Polyangiaceae bacterium]
MSEVSGGDTAFIRSEDDTRLLPWGAGIAGATGRGVRSDVVAEAVARATEVRRGLFSNGFREPKVMMMTLTPAYRARVAPVCRFVKRPAPAFRDYSNVPRKMMLATVK